jgi:D-alanyl-D-alanine carboxypeptidase/D-alanyl-D-alanine-endopeptidase (penicillin-binding protein 4)
MLRTIALDNQWFTPFYTSLPEAGRTGSMKSMFKNYPSVIGRIKAKSGTISRVRAYSGYATAMDGRLIAFSVVLNNFTCSQNDIRKRLEKFMAELVKL